jgi:bacterioferritin-associated ferredoxin
MYVCLCLGFTDRQVRAARERSDGCVSGVYSALGGAPRCGKCVPMVRDILREGASLAGGGDSAASG